MLGVAQWCNLHSDFRDNRIGRPAIEMCKLTRRCLGPLPQLVATYNFIDEVLRWLLIITVPLTVVSRFVESKMLTRMRFSVILKLLGLVGSYHITSKLRGLNI